MRKIDEGRRDHQPAAARRRDGFRALARQALDRTLTERHPAAAEGAVGFHAQHRQVVRERLLSHMALSTWALSTWALSTWALNCDGLRPRSCGDCRFLAAPRKRLYMSPAP